MKLIKLLILILAIVISIAGCKNVEVNEPVAAVVGKVVKVVDGDTLHVYNSKGTYKIRLSGIDAPERGQAYGKRAKEHLQKLVGGRQVIAIVESKDRYGRYVASVKCEKTASSVGLSQRTKSRTIMSKSQIVSRETFLLFRVNFCIRKR